MSWVALSSEALQTQLDFTTEQKMSGVTRQITPENRQCVWEEGGPPRATAEGPASEGLQ